MDSYISNWIASYNNWNLLFYVTITDNDLDGEALVAALDHGPEALKEAIPSLGKRLKLIRVLKSLSFQDQQVVTCVT